MAKPRTSEKVWRWIAIGMIILYMLSLLVEWLHLNLVALIIITVAVLIFIFLLVREKPPTNFVDCLEDCANLQFTHNGQLLSMNIRDAEVIPDGPAWIAFFWKSSDHGFPAAYRYDPFKRAVIGREINDYEAILKRIDQSKVLSALAEQTMRKRQERAAAERSGMDTSEMESDHDE